MYAKAQKKKEKNFALTIIYLVVITTKAREKVDFLSLFLLSNVVGCFLLEGKRSNNDE
jgi:hypothetical protein